MISGTEMMKDILRARLPRFFFWRQFVLNWAANEFNWNARIWIDLISEVEYELQLCDVPSTFIRGKLERSSFQSEKFIWLGI